MAYRALYREWRPKDFSHVVGQKAIIGTLRNQVVNRRIAHAYLFCGSRGTGKTSTAKILAKAINCLDPVEGDPCGKCENCLRMDQDETLDVIEIDAASNNGVDEMRELRDTVKYPPQYGTYKVYIIDEVHMLSTSAFNALLKTLEEPPAHIVFILATTEPQKLPETILSRCQRFDFGRISVSEIAGRLREAAEGCGAKVTDGALMLIARAADGGMRDALSILDMCLGYSDDVDESLVRNTLGTSDSSFLFRYCESLAQQDAAGVLGMIDEIMREGKDPAVFARDVCRHIRALLIAKTAGEDLPGVLDITQEEAADYLRQGERFTLTRLMKILDVYMALETEMRYASTPRLALENASLKCCLRTEETDQQALLDRIGELEKKILDLENRIGNGTAATAPSVQKEEKEKTSQVLREPAATAGQSAPASRLGRNETAAWKEMMDRFLKTDPSLCAFLNLGSVSCRGDHYYWQANKQESEAVYVNTLNKEEKRRKICDCLSSIIGRTCDFTAMERTSGTPAQDKSDEAYLNRLYETFGAEPVDVVDSLK